MDVCFMLKTIVNYATEVEQNLSGMGKKGYQTPGQNLAHFL